MMESGIKKQKNILDDGLSNDLMNAGRFCFSCEQIFASGKCRDDHVCPATSYICSCGTEFTVYEDMLEHSTTHEPGHQVLDHKTIKRRRVEKRAEEEEQLNRLQTGEVVWKAPKLSTHTSNVSTQPAQVSQVPARHSSVSQASLIPNPECSTAETKNIFADLGSPTVDLWTLYQPVVMLNMVHTYTKKRPYCCGKCGVTFMTKSTLMYHVNTHFTDKLSGCVGCGLLLSSKKIVPRFHVCGSRNTAKYRLVTARPSDVVNQATSLLFQTNQNFSANIPSHSSEVSSNMQLKNQNVQTCSLNNHRLHQNPSLQLKVQNPILPKAYGITSPKTKTHSPYSNTVTKICRGLPVTTYGQLKTLTNPQSGVAGSPKQTQNSFPCRICHIPFETAQLLQRHKCVKAKEFMAQHAQGGRQPYKLNRVRPVTSPNLINQINGDRKLGASVSRNPVMSLAMGQGVVPVNGKTVVDLDDDCYIVEDGPEKPAEVIYQVTSSVPIIT